MKDRLIKVFQLFFKLEPNEICNVSQENNCSWDSLTSISLITVIEEDFGVSIGIEEIESLTSFSAFFEYLNGKNS